MCRKYYVGHKINCPTASPTFVTGGSSNIMLWYNKFASLWLCNTSTDTVASQMITPCTVPPEDSWSSRPLLKATPRRLLFPWFLQCLLMQKAALLQPPSMFLFPTKTMTCFGVSYSFDRAYMTTHLLTTTSEFQIPQ